MGYCSTGSFKTAVTIDLNSVSKNRCAPGHQADCVTSVVVDDQFEESGIESRTPWSRSTQAVAGAVGYVEERDTIHISKASFLPKRQMGIIQLTMVDTLARQPKKIVLYLKIRWLMNWADYCEAMATIWD